MSIADKIKGMLGQHGDKAEQTVDKAGDMFDEKTGGKYADKVDKGQDAAKNYMDREAGNPPEGGQPNQP